MNQLRNVILLIAALLAAWLPLIAPAAAAPARQAATPSATPSATPPVRVTDVRPILARMTVADKVGQLFLVSFQGSDASAGSDIAALIRDYRVGGVVLLPANDNFRNVPVAAPVTTTQSAAPTQTLSTPQQIIRLTNALQSLALSSPRPITVTAALTVTAPRTATTALTTTVALTATAALTPTATATLTLSPTVTATAPKPESPPTATVPLLIGLDWVGDDSSFFAGAGGFSPLPSAMALGAAWLPAQAEQVGQVVGQELAAAGVNLLLGPTLDVLDAPRPGSRGDLDTRTFGGDPFWVGQMGQAFIRGLQAGSDGAVISAAKHFPGQGGADRRPEDEVATVQKSLQQLRQIELAPFVAVTAGGDLNVPGTTAALMTSHIRYRGLQGNIRQLTPPISLAPQLQDLMALKEFADWRTAGGVLVSDALGVPALRRYYDPTLQKFPHRQVAQDAFLAGNDLLYLGRFALTDAWPDQFTAIKETILFFQGKYRDDSAFRARVDASVERIVRMKLRIAGGEGELRNPADVNAPVLSAVEGPVLSAVEGKVGQGGAITLAVARAGLTLIYPGRDELADRLPSAPLADENLVIFTETRLVRECAACESLPAIAPTALQQIMLRLYGPSGTGQLAPGRVRSFTFTDLNRLLAAPPDQEAEIEKAITAARWIIFAQLDYNPQEYPESAALQTFLAKRSDSLRDKRLVVLAFNAPYYLDTTEISKLTAYFGVYGKTAPFLETAVRALFREFTPIGAPPVSVAGVASVLINRLEPGPGQIISLGQVGPPLDASGVKTSIQIGSRILLETSVILDRNGHPVPDGTLVEFRLRYPVESLDLAPKVETTSGGKARTTVILDRPGTLWITAQAGEATDSARIVLTVGGDAPGSIATVLPSPTPSPTSTATPPPTATLTPEPSPTVTVAPTPTPTPAPPPKPRVALPAFFFGLLGAVLAGGAAFGVRRRIANAARQATPHLLSVSVAAGLWAVATAWAAYLLYSLGWLPGATQLQAGGRPWVAGAVTLAAGLLSLLWSSGALKWLMVDRESPS
ncbi:MAG: hypothetical protein NT169_16500 [Chloroflexi bacterium]|nr:hypothetical protein [Chloroflexota bacterium]